MTQISVPEPIGPELTFRWFTEYVVDNSPLFRTASAVAKASLLLAADLDTVGGKPSLNESAIKLVRDALEADLELPTLSASRTDEDGNPVGEPIKIPPRVFSRFIDAWMTDVEST